jgi:beta-galactosidase/beta-glucuronidase
MKYTLVFVFCLLFVTSFSQDIGWKIVPGKITTPWAEKVSPEKVLPEYPRPHMERGSWLNLNGLWSYSITNKEETPPSSYSGQILVPFPVESALSGVGKRVGKDNKLWYRRSVRVPSSMKGKTILLHFGAVDWRCEVFVNGSSAGVHEGGYDPFYFDITSFIKGSGEQEIVVSVWDPSDDGPQPRGKQVEEPKSIWYTPVTGIWQTVWLEGVPQTYISSTRHTPDIDKNQLQLHASVANRKAGDRLRVSVWDGSAKIAEQESESEQMTLALDNPKLWSPSSPHLYNLRISVVRKGRTVDEIKSYFAMRKISMAPDANGIQRMMLNNQFVFQYGPLDQGWWPDGLYTAPTDEALKFDVGKTKEMGFNMIRKHVKVEPARWYYHCDQLGMLVWQDMPSGDMGNRWESRPGVVGIATEKERTAASEAIFRREWKAIMDALHNFPSIVVWVPFNEAWGQFKTREIVESTQNADPSRLVNEASGGNFHYTGHMIDLHNYPAPAMPDPQMYGRKQIVVLGEFGGLGLPLEGHTWQEKNNWGYQSFSSPDELLAKYDAFMKSLQPLIEQGLSAAVYTQTTDVEIETNGLMTYDRKVIKMPEAKLNQLHAPLYKTNVK